MSIVIRLLNKVCFNRLKMYTAAVMLHFRSMLHIRLFPLLFTLVSMSHEAFMSSWYLWYTCPNWQLVRVSLSYRLSRSYQLRFWNTTEDVTRGGIINVIRKTMLCTDSTTHVECNTKRHGNWRNFVTTNRKWLFCCDTCVSADPVDWCEWSRCVAR